MNTFHVNLYISTFLANDNNYIKYMMLLLTNALCETEKLWRYITYIRYKMNSATGKRTL